MWQASTSSGPHPFFFFFFFLSPRTRTPGSNPGGEEDDDENRRQSILYHLSLTMSTTRPALSRTSSSLFPTPLASAPYAQNNKSALSGDNAVLELGDGSRLQRYQFRRRGNERSRRMRFSDRYVVTFLWGKNFQTFFSIRYGRLHGIFN